MNKRPDIQTPFGRYMLAVDIQLTSPLNIAAVEKGRYVFDGAGSRVIRNDADIGIPCTLQTTYTSMVPNEFGEVGAENGNDASNRAAKIPCIPASTLKGALRNASANLLTSSLSKRGQMLSTNAFNTLYSGAATTNIASSEKTPEVVRAFRDHAFFSNFGGTAFMAPGRIVASDGLPLIQMVKSHMAYPPMIDEAEIGNMTMMRQMCTARSIVRKDAIADMKIENLFEIVSTEEVEKYLLKNAEAAKDRKNRKSEDAEDQGKKTALRSISAIETVNPGMYFGLRLQVNALTPAQLGMMILGLQSVLRNNAIGGRTANGFGQFFAHTSCIVKVDDRGRFAPENAERLFGDRESGYHINIDSDTINAAVREAQAFIEDCDASLIEAISNADVDEISKYYDSAKKKPAKKAVDDQAVEAA